MAKSKSSTKSELIPAVAYLRKSTKGEATAANGNKRERQEKSIDRQRTDVAKLAAEHDCRVVAEYSDAGVSGWKRGAKRPGFARMVDEVAELGAKAIICEDLDRFSRATVGEVQSDAQRLIERGVRYIITERDVYDLGDKHGIGEIVKFVAAVWAASEFSRKLGYRIAVTRANAAKQGKRAGAPAPHGYVNEYIDGKFTGRIKPGDEAEIALVRRMFSMLVDEGASVRSIAVRLNEEGAKSRRGNKWTRGMVACILGNPAYCGAFQYGASPEGNFYRLDSKGEVVAVDDLEPGEKGKVFLKHDAHEAIIDKATWTKAQKLIAGRKLGRQRTREHSHLFSGRVYCTHCGEKMRGAAIDGRVIYRCGSYVAAKGCRQNIFAEKLLLPFVVRTLAAEMNKLAAPAPQIPLAIEYPDCDRLYRAEKLSCEIDELEGKLRKAVARILEIDDADDRREADALRRQWREELKVKEAELVAVRQEQATKGGELSEDERERLAAWVAEWEAGMLDTGAGCVDAGGFRNLLAELNVRIDLKFKVVPYGQRSKYQITSGRMTWGDGQAAKLRPGDLASMPNGQSSTHRWMQWNADTSPGSKTSALASLAIGAPRGLARTPSHRHVNA